MKNKFTEKLLNIWDKIKKSRRLQILLLSAVFLIIIVCYFSFNFTNKNKTNIENDTTSSYAEKLENKLEKMLTSIDGAGTVTVAITLENGFEYIYATEEEVKTTSSGTLKNTSIVLVSGEPIIVKELYPTIKGVVIVASGAKDVKVKLNILSAVQTVLEVTNDKITILN